MALSVALALGGAGAAARLTRHAEWLAERRRLVWAPLLALIVPKLAMLFVVSERQGLFHDWTAHAEYVPILLFGFALGGSERLWPAIARGWRACGGVALLAGAAIVTIELTYQGHNVPPHLVMAVDRSARLAMAWGMTVVLLQLADLYWNRDGRWRATLCEAVFPFYLVHEPALVLLAAAVLPLGLNPALSFAILLGGTAATCLIVYRVGREIAWLRPLIGLAPRVARDAGSAKPTGEERSAGDGIGRVELGRPRWRGAVPAREHRG